MDKKYPEGKLNAHDEGVLTMLIGRESGKVKIQFPKPVEWVAFTPEQAIHIAERLVAQARLCGCSMPLVLSVG